MNGDAFKRVRQGDPMQIQAAAWNACLDAAEAAKRGGGGGLADAVGRQFRQADIVLVKNASGSDVSRFHVLGISGVIFSPTDSLQSFQNQVAFTGETPDEEAHKGKFVVCLDAMKNGQVGRAWIAGTCAAKVYIEAESDSYCDVKEGDRTELRSTDSGSARILYKPSGTGSKWCVVRFGNPSSDSIRIGKTVDPWLKNTEADIPLWEGGTPGAEADSSETLEGCVNKMANVSAGRWVLLAKARNGGHYLVWAEPDLLDVVTAISLTGEFLQADKKTVAVYIHTPDPSPDQIELTDCPPPE